ncbi:serine hydrolase domain-containing protein [Caulobacter soli]|uniref:serine hydrolase domain-containing protein n=1 Tax=Caulobacter soli TaxID=2708539 RepID=UPI00196A890A|nr:serine hydrolase domain-containing protein [Caulobacter soli]
MESLAVIDEVGRMTTDGTLDPVPWWSFTKTVLAIAALRLVEQGALSLDAPAAGASHSLAQLLRHEAGLPDYGGLARYHEDVAAGREPWPVERLLVAVDADRPRYAPGEGWAYSNIGYLHVGRLIAAASGLNLGRALAELVFEPTNLASARLATTPEDLAGVRMGRDTGYHPGWVYHGLVTGTTADAARLVRALLAGAILRPETLARMTEGRALPEHRSALYPDPAYGLGLMLAADHPWRHPIGHTGGGPGSDIAVYGQGARACAVWSDAGTGPEPVVTAAFRRLAESEI